MTLAVIGKIPAGFILATDSIQEPASAGAPHALAEAGSRILLSPRRPRGALIWGAEGLGGRTLAEATAALEGEEEGGELTIEENARHLAQCLARRSLQKFEGLLPYLRPRIGFFLAGYEMGGRAPSDWVWEISEPFSPPRPLRTGREAETSFGFNWRGLDLWMTRLLLGYDPALLGQLEAGLGTSQERLLPIFRRMEMPISYSNMDLEQAMGMASFLIHTTLGLLHLQTYPRKWSWDIQIAIITPQGTRWAKRREGEGEGEEKGEGGN